VSAVAASPLATRGLKPAAQLAAGRPHGDRLRYIAGCRCGECRGANAAYERARIDARKAGDWNGIVPADRARAHLLDLAEKGVGRRAVEAATDIANSILFSIRSGKRTQIRARTERLILAVSIEQASDRALIDAKPTWKLIHELQRAGFTKTAIAAGLGMERPALQLGRRRVTVRNAAAVARLHARLMDSDEALVPAAPTWALIRELREECFTDLRIARAIGFEDGRLAIGKVRVPRGLARRVEAAHRSLMQ
jgi:hypothetical protein